MLPFSAAKPLRLGTRSSKMAMIQAELVKLKLAKAHEELAHPDAIKLVPMNTTGCNVQDRRLSEVGGKGLFVKELEIALLDGEIDIAVHAMKDVPSILPDGFAIAAILQRDEPWDVFISPHGKTLDDLPQGATLGTSAPRREALTLARRPDIKVVMFRGNADTRLEKLANGDVHATYLSLAGLKRIERFKNEYTIMSPELLLPAAGQGAVGVEILADRVDLLGMMQAINHVPSYRCVKAERAALAQLDGNCHSPLAAYAEIRTDGLLHLRALAAKLDGTLVIRHEVSGAQEHYRTLGLQAGQAIKDQLPPDFFDAA